MTRGRRIPCWVAAVPIVLALLVLVTWIPGKAVLDGDLERSARAALAAGGITGVSVDVDGARGVLRGPAELEGRARDVLRVGGGAGTLRSVRYVADSTGSSASPTTAAPTPATPGATSATASTTSAVTLSPVTASVAAVAEVAGNRILLTGNVSTAGVRSSIVGAASAAFGATRVDDRLTVVAGATPPSPAVLAAVDRFATLVNAAGPRLERGTLSMVDTAISITGSGFNPRATTELSAAVSQADGNGITASGTLQAAPSDRTTLQAQLSSLLGRSGINFASGSDEIDAPSRAVLDTAAASIQAVPTARIAVNGHTDGEGSADANRELSTRRAEAVVAYLVAQGVDAAQLTAAGYGADQPIADNGTAEGRAANRRIEFAVTRS